MDTYVTFYDLMTFIIMLTSVISLCYVVFSDKNNKHK